MRGGAAVSGALAPGLESCRTLPLLSPFSTVLTQLPLSSKWLALHGGKQGGQQLLAHISQLHDLFPNLDKVTDWGGGR